MVVLGGGRFLMSEEPLYSLQGWVSGVEHLQNARQAALATMKKWLNQTIAHAFQVRPPFDGPRDEGCFL